MNNVAASQEPRLYFLEGLVLKTLQICGFTQSCIYGFRRNLFAPVVLFILDKAKQVVA